MKTTCVAMILAGGQGSRLGALTKRVAKPAVPFGGKYRIIDFPLSNCAHSGIERVGVLTQYRPFELHNYVGNGDAWDLDVRDGGVFSSCRRMRVTRGLTGTVARLMPSIRICISYPFRTLIMCWCCQATTFIPWIIPK